uniref:Uncharacterized protein n=1 Tax=Cacopsylla melanoneura TaxID=428564 RepID=A0A8D9E6P2_9HEMI
MRGCLEIFLFFNLHYAKFHVDIFRICLSKDNSKKDVELMGLSHGNWASATEKKEKRRFCQPPDLEFIAVTPNSTMPNKMDQVDTLYMLVCKRNTDSERISQDI